MVKRKGLQIPKLKEVYENPLLVLIGIVIGFIVVPMFISLPIGVSEIETKVMTSAVPEFEHTTTQGLWSGLDSDCAHYYARRKNLDTSKTIVQCFLRGISITPTSSYDTINEVICECRHWR